MDVGIGRNCRIENVARVRDRRRVVVCELKSDV